ncbi:MAG: hypothetical protein HYT76_09505 [Deltaproteobacteria bacterium]|nr:hypothetical protein [Deltaproteobacteria bacterium]
MSQGLATRGWRGFVSLLAFLTAFWVVCPYVCTAAEADQSVHACCTEMAGFEASTLCCGSMESQAYLPSSTQEGFSASPVALTVNFSSYVEPRSIYRLSRTHLLDPPKTLVSEKITLLL